MEKMTSKNNKKKWTKKQKGIFFVAVLLLIIGLAIKITLGIFIIETEHIEVKNGDVPKDFDGFTIVHISDLHNASFGKGNKTLINKIKKENPDIIVVTGDLIDSRRTKVNVSLDFMKKANEIAPVFFVTGNHEVRKIDSEYLELKTSMEKLGIHIMDSKEFVIERNSSKIYIYGVGDPLHKSTSREIDVLKQITSNNIKEINIDENNFSILLSHRAEHLSVYEENKINLTFAGHQHGGQIRTPIKKKGLYSQDNKYISGSYKHKYGEMIVSRGLGNSVNPIRINNRPHLVVAKLKAA